MVVLLGSSSDFLSGCAASLHIEIIIGEKTVKTNKNKWQRSLNVLTCCEKLLRSLLGSCKGEDNK